MCIMIAKNKDLILKEKILKNCFNNNPDGAGFCVENEDKSFTIEKGFFSFESFYSAFQPHETKKALLHFRIRTHGDTDIENCHPFEVSDTIVFAHNGIISNVPTNKNKSDTRVFKDLY